MYDTGESTASMIAKSDDRSWPRVSEALRNGATLLYIPKLRNGYVDTGSGPTGPSLSRARIRKLEKEGVLRHVGIDRYALAEAV